MQFQAKTCNLQVLQVTINPLGKVALIGFSGPACLLYQVR